MNNADRATNLASSLVRGEQRIVAIDACRDAGPDALAIVAILDQALAARKSVLHSLTFTCIENSWVTTFAACHRFIVFVLC